MVRNNNITRNPSSRRTSRRNNFGWTNPNLDLSMDNPENRRIFEQILIQTERDRITNAYLGATVFLTRFAGVLYDHYRGLDFEVMRIDYYNPRDPVVPTLTLVHTKHTTTNYRDPENYIWVHLELLNENMLR